MRIKKITISSRPLDTPKYFPAPCQPSLLTAPDVRIKTQPTEDEEVYIDPKVKAEDAQKSVKFGSRVLCSDSKITITVPNGSYGPSGPFFFIALFPDGSKYKYYFESTWLRNQTMKERFNIGKFSSTVKKNSYTYEKLK